MKGLGRGKRYGQEQKIYALKQVDLGKAFTAPGRRKEAIEKFRKAVQLEPDLPGALDNLELAKRAAHVR